MKSIKDFEQKKIEGKFKKGGKRKITGGGCIPKDIRIIGGPRNGTFLTKRNDWNPFNNDKL